MVIMCTICLTCKHDITFYTKGEPGDKEFFIEECWCGGYLIDRRLIGKIINYNKIFHKLYKEMGKNIKENRERINNSIVNWIMEEEEGLYLRIYLGNHKNIKNPEKYFLNIVNYVISSL